MQTLRDINFYPVRKKALPQLFNGVYKTFKILQLKYEEAMKKKRKKYGELKVRGKGSTLSY